MVGSRAPSTDADDGKFTDSYKSENGNHFQTKTLQESNS